MTITVQAVDGPHAGQTFKLPGESVTLCVASFPKGLFLTEEPEMVVNRYTVSGDRATWRDPTHPIFPISLAEFALCSVGTVLAIYAIGAVVEVQ